MQQGPTLRILFRLSPCVNLFYLFLFYTFLACKMSKEAIGTICKNMACRLNDACYTSNLIQNVFGVLFSHHLRSFPMSDCHTCLDTRVHYQGLYSAWYILKSPNTYRECSASRVWPYMHQLRIMYLVNSWVARLLFLLPYVPLYRLR